VRLQQFIDESSSIVLGDLRSCRTVPLKTAVRCGAIDLEISSRISFKEFFVVSAIYARHFVGLWRIQDHPQGPVPTPAT